jgi:hypothetical protein
MLNALRSTNPALAGEGGQRRMYGQGLGKILFILYYRFFRI